MVENQLRFPRVRKKCQNWVVLTCHIIKMESHVVLQVVFQAKSFLIDLATDFATPTRITEETDESYELAVSYEASLALLTANVSAVNYFGLRHVMWGQVRVMTRASS